MRRALFVAALTVGLLAVTVPASAHGVSPAKLSRAGWDCFNVPGLGVHCAPPGVGASEATLSLLVFDTDDPESTHAPFQGTELLIHTDLFRGQRCPQDGGVYHDLSGDGLPYMACHHYDTSA